MGRVALEGRPGVLKVESGWQGLREVDRVTFDPAKVTVEQMEIWLRESGTFIQTLEWERPPPPTAGKSSSP